MAKILSSKHGVFPSKGVTVLADKQATRDNMLSALRGVFGGTAADETVFAYLAGHGVEIGGRYLCPNHVGRPKIMAGPTGQVHTRGVGHN